MVRHVFTQMSQVERLNDSRPGDEFHRAIAHQIDMINDRFADLQRRDRPTMDVLRQVDESMYAILQYNDNLRFEAKPGQVLPITICIGASIFPHDGDSYETLLATADSRMYRDKTRRKRESGGGRGGDEHARPAAVDSVSDAELQRAAVGVL